jgi:hypothetical protein
MSKRLGSTSNTLPQVPATVPYGLVSANGGVFSFGDASFQGSAAGLRLGGHVVSMATERDV